MRWQFRAMQLILCVACTGPGPARSSDFTVDRLDDSVDSAPGDGQCADSLSGCSLRAAILEANALPGVDRILLPPGTLSLSRPGHGDDAGVLGDLDVADAVEIVGAGTGKTTIDAMQLDRVFDLVDSGTGEIVLRDLTLRNGRNDTSAPFAQPSGIGLQVHAGVQVRLYDVVIREQRSTGFNTALGIASFGGCIIGRRVRILDNRDPGVPDASGLRPLSGGIVTSGATSCLDLEDLEISGNDADIAGALYADDGAPVTLRRALIAGNRARAVGAMLFNRQNLVLLENVTISGNHGNGAVLNDGGALVTLVNSTVTGNVGLHGSPTVGGLHDVHGIQSRIRLSNTIVAGNGPGSLASDCNRVASLDGGNLIGTTSCSVSSAQASDQLGVDPQLQPLSSAGGFTRAHLAGTPTIDRGTAAGCPGSDQRGVVRPQDGDGDGTAACDVGAVEAPLADLLWTDGFE